MSLKSFIIVFWITAARCGRTAGFTVSPKLTSPFLGKQMVARRSGRRGGSAPSRQLSVALGASDQSTNQAFRTKDRQEELTRIAQQMELDIPGVKQLLTQQRSKMSDQSDKAALMDWLLQEVAANPNNGQDEKQDYEEPSIKKQKKSRPKRSTAVTAQVEAKEADAQVRHSEALKDPTLLTNIMFAERTDLHPSTKRAITEVMGLKAMTEIQAKTFAAAGSGKSVLARARTGTGKTIAFLLPALERLLKGERDLYHPGRNVGILVVSPTRELAIQIADQAKQLLTFHGSDLSVLCIYGGTKIQRDTAQLNRKIPTILVATPGRLLDHIGETRVINRKFSDILSETKIVVLDETDRLLDMGFQKDIKKVLSFLPRPEKRQTLLFSATLPKELRAVMDEVMDKDYVEVDCISDSDAKTHTNMQVEQTYILLDSMDRYVSTLVDLVTHAIADDDDYKVVVFFPAAKLVRFFADYFTLGLDIPVVELHSRISQSARERASAQFRSAKRSILFTSDVSARGVDYPDVTLVIQYGSADNEETYVHRLGRTGRAGKTGKGLLVLLPFESNFQPMLKRHNITEDPMMESMNLAADNVIDKQILLVRDRIRSGDAKLTTSAEGGYRAFLACYTNRRKALGMTPKVLVQNANQFARNVGLNKIPPITKRIAGKMNLVGVEGIVIEK